MRTGLLVLLTLALAAFPAVAGADDLERLTVEYGEEPLGLAEDGFAVYEVGPGRWRFDVG
jgi:hypothetical protein